MKKLLFLSIMILLLGGCSLVYIEKQSIDEIVDSVLTHDVDIKSVSLEGYSYYLPHGVNLSSNSKGNSILYYNHNKMYLYVDLVSYYHNVSSNYEENNTSYYSRNISINGHNGYLQITQVSTKYFVEFMYNYSKIEAYVNNKNDLNKTINTMAYILNSVHFQDTILDSLIGDKSLNYSEETFNIFKPNGVENDFLDFVDKYDDGRKDSKDEDVLDLDGSIE